MDLNEDVIVFVLVICSKSSCGIAFDPHDDITKRQTDKIPAGPVLP